MTNDLINHDSVSILSCVLVTRSCPTLCNPMDCSPPDLLCLWDYPGKNTEVDYHSLLQWIFPTQGSNPGLLHCRQIKCKRTEFAEFLDPWTWGNSGRVVHPESMEASPLILSSYFALCISFIWMFLSYVLL